VPHEAKRGAFGGSARIMSQPRIEQGTCFSVAGHIGRAGTEAAGGAHGPGWVDQGGETPACVDWGHKQGIKSTDVSRVLNLHPQKHPINPKLQKPNPHPPHPRGQPFGRFCAGGGRVSREFVRGPNCVGCGRQSRTYVFLSNRKHGGEHGKFRTTGGPSPRLRHAPMSTTCALVAQACKSTADTHTRAATISPAR